MTFPTGDPDPVAYVEIDVVASFTPSTGLLAVDGKLSPASYLLGGFVKLTGGFAFYAWFSGRQPGRLRGQPRRLPPRLQQAGATTRSCPRLGLAFSLGPLKVIGQAYFALTPACSWPGLRLTATFEAGPVRAWFDAGRRLPDPLGAVPLRGRTPGSRSAAPSISACSPSASRSAPTCRSGDRSSAARRSSTSTSSRSRSPSARTAHRRPVGLEHLRGRTSSRRRTPAAAPAGARWRRRSRRAQLRPRSPPEAAGTPVRTSSRRPSRPACNRPGPAGVDWIVDPDHFRILTASTIPANHGLWAPSATDTAELPNVVANYRRAPGAARFAAARRPPRRRPQMLLLLDYETKTFSDTQVWAPELNIAPMDKPTSTPTTRSRCASATKSGALHQLHHRRHGHPAAGRLQHRAVGGPGAEADPNADRLIQATLTGLAISPVPRNPDQVSDVPLLSLIFGEGTRPGSATSHQPSTRATPSPPRSPPTARRSRSTSRASTPPRSPTTITCSPR